jgi:hypothetical protein
MDCAFLRNSERLEFSLKLAKLLGWNQVALQVSGYIFLTLHQLEADNHASVISIAVEASCSNQARFFISGDLIICIGG